VDYIKRVERKPIRGSVDRASIRVQRQSPWWGSGMRSPLKLKVFVHFYTKERPKVKDLNETLQSKILNH